MNKKIIKKYIKRLNASNIYMFASKNNIILSENEIEFIIDIINNDYDNYEEILMNLKKGITPPNFEKINYFYLKYKDKLP